MCYMRIAVVCTDMQWVVVHDMRLTCNATACCTVMDCIGMQFCSAWPVVKGCRDQHGRLHHTVRQHAHYSLCWPRHDWKYNDFCRVWTGSTPGISSARANRGTIPTLCGWRTIQDQHFCLEPLKRSHWSPVNRLYCNYVGEERFQISTFTVSNFPSSWFSLCDF